MGLLVGDHGICPKYAIKSNSVSKHEHLMFSHSNLFNILIIDTNMQLTKQNFKKSIKILYVAKIYSNHIKKWRKTFVFFKMSNLGTDKSFPLSHIIHKSTFTFQI